MKSFAAALAALTLAAAGSASAATVNIWSNDFDAGGYFQTLGPFPWSVLSVNTGGGFFAGSESLPGFGSQYLRNSTTGTTSFSASGLGAHSDLHLSFDVAFIDSWDSFGGNCCGPDILSMNIDNVAPLALTWNGGGGFGPNFGPGTVVGIGQLAVSGWYDAVVHYDFIIPHSSSTFQFNISAGGFGWQGGDDESWGFDNLSLSATPAGRGVPEPASWALMITGFGLAGAALRRRRAFVPA